jgi:signal transduction histidine kinase
MCKTQLRAELAAMKERESIKADYMRMLVHELRSPVCTSKSMVAALRHLNGQDAQFDNFLARIETRMDQLLDLVNDVLYLSQAKAGDPSEQAVVLDLVAATRAVCEPYLEEAAAKGLDMTVQLPEVPVWVRVAEQDYHLILSNLVSNAVKYTSAGSVTVALWQEGPWAVLKIEDSGMGIPQGEMSQLFNEFFRASNARRSRIPGTGLGLASVKTLVERCKGDLQVASEEKAGSRFTARLPLWWEDVPQPLGLR